MHTKGLVASLVLFFLTFTLVAAASLSGATGFLENRGQVDERVLFYARGKTGAVYFTREAVVIDLREDLPVAEGGREAMMDPGFGLTEAVDRQQHPRRCCGVYIRFEGARESPVVEAHGETPTRYNFFLGRDPAKWQREVPAFSEITYRDLWPGVDLVYRIDDGELTYDLVSRRAAALSHPRFRYEGATDVIAVEGGYLIETALRTLLDRRPDRKGQPGSLLMATGDATSSEPGPLADNPSALLWSTFLGGAADWDYAEDVMMTSGGCPLVVGESDSWDFPVTPGAYDETNSGDFDAFVSKLDPTGSSLVWSTLIGGSVYDWAVAGDLDASGNIVITGWTDSGDFPCTYDLSDLGRDAFIVKIDASGSLLHWSTLLGGSSPYQRAADIAVDAVDRPVILGYTEAADFPTTPGAYDETYNGDQDLFVAKLTPSGGSLVWSTYIGGDGHDEGRAISFDSQGNPVIVGYTSVSTIHYPSTPGVYDQTYNGSYDVFVTKLDSSGTSLVWSTFIGTSGPEVANDVCHDADDNPVLTGYSYHFPTTPGAYDVSYSGDTEVFVTKLSSSGDSLVWSTYLGGPNYEEGYALTLDALENPVVTGYTQGPFPTTEDAYDRSSNGSYDCFISKLDATGSSLLWSSFLGGSDIDFGAAVALDSLGNPVIFGQTASYDLPTTAAGFDTSYNGGMNDTFVAKLDMTGLASVYGKDAPVSLAATVWPAPNPFRAAVEIRFHLDRRERVKVAVYDISGRIISILFEGELPEGDHSLSWLGKDDSGRQAAPGIYFGHIEAGNKSRAVKIVMAR